MNSKAVSLELLEMTGWFTMDVECSPLFVTWNTRSNRLRGCIGNFEAMPIHKGIAQYALISAFRDSRFDKIEEWELDSLECGYAIL